MPDTLGNTIITKKPENSQPTFSVDRFRIGYWAHKWAGYNRTPQQQADIAKLQSARARKRWHGHGHARIGIRNRHACQLFQRGDLTDAAIARRLNGAHAWRLSPISRRQVANIRHHHTDCVPGSPCLKLDLLETNEPVATANPNMSHSAIGLDGPIIASQSVAYPSNPIMDRHCHPYISRTIRTRYGRLTYLHNTDRWPLTPPGG